MHRVNQSADVQCPIVASSLRHVQFFSVIDAIYGATMFKHLAASPAVDHLIMDSNFMVRSGEGNQAYLRRISRGNLDAWLCGR